MKIQTQFDVHNLVKHKFSQRGENHILALEVMEIITTSCYAGTQVFYLCRPLIASNKKMDFIKESKDKWEVAYAVDKKDSSSLLSPYDKFREDELVNLTQKEIDIILGAEKTDL